MYDEEEKQDDDDELEDIIEEAHEEESDQSEDKRRRHRNKRDSTQKSESKNDDRRLQTREELKNLKTQMLTMKDQLMRKANKIEEIKNTLKQSQMLITKQNSSSQQSQDKEALTINQAQKSFIGGVPTDQIIDVLDEDEEILATKLGDINENEEPEKDQLILNSEESEEGMEFGSEGSNVDEDDDGMDNGIQNQIDP